MDIKPSFSALCTADPHHLLIAGSGPCLRHQHWQTHWDCHPKGGEVTWPKPLTLPNSIRAVWLPQGDVLGRSLRHTSDSYLSSSGRPLKALSQHRVLKSGHPSPVSGTVPPAAVTQRPLRCMRSGGQDPATASHERVPPLTVMTSASEPPS